MFVQVFMQGRLKETLPQILEDCGYRTLMLFPMDKGFLSLDRFYRSIGFSEIWIGKPRAHPRIESVTVSISAMRSRLWNGI